MDALQLLKELRAFSREIDVNADVFRIKKHKIPRVEKLKDFRNRKFRAWLGSKPSSL